MGICKWFFTVSKSNWNLELFRFVERQENEKKKKKTLGAMMRTN